MGYSVVWFKRDLRLHDHAALHHACHQGPVLCLYVIEPSLWAQPDAATQHYTFIAESLRDLRRSIQQLGGQLHVVCGEVPDVLARLHAAMSMAALYSHEETGNGATFERDKAVARWAKNHGVPWHQPPQFGVVRRLPSRDDWQPAWLAHMALPQYPTPTALHCQPWPDAVQGIAPLQALPAPSKLGLHQSDPPQRQRGGRALGLQVLHSFLYDRSAQYQGGISSPLSAPTACSRLSPYITYGCLSMREVVQATRQRMADEPSGSWHKKGLAAFTSRLHWHCHFIQKLESEPAIEWHNMHRGYNGLREADWNPAHFDALVAGRTGWPMVDACVAMLRETGWVNFRMRAMLVSVASYPLWLHWRPVGLWLAQQFLDYEPGIHWSQMQMQAGTTGINTTRVYNPIKQAQDHDPHGHFVRQWLPAMQRVPDTWLLEPWLMPADVQARYGVQLGTDIAQPLVPLEEATRTAKARMHSLRAQPQVRAAKAAVLEKHGSRKRSPSAPSSSHRKAASAPVTAPSTQQELDF
jgi:deoxyribodipyrimidine photo-lyase